MRILAIRGCNLASIAGDFAIDFEAEPLAGSGIFAITGPTGAGKSTLLDALNLALFGKLPRLSAAPSRVRIRVGDDEDIPADDARGILRHGTGEGYAEADFAIPGGARYRARWSVGRARQRATGRLQNAAQSFRRLDTDEVLGGTRTETLAAIREVIGLSAEQFGRAVLLAQGDFEAFVRADANDRALLLERLTGSAIYARLGQRAWEKAGQLRNDLDAIRRDIEAQNGLDDTARAEAEARRDLALADEQAAAGKLAELTLAHQWERRRGELNTLAESAEQADFDTQAAVAAAAPRHKALSRDRAAFAFSGEWLAVAEALRLRDEAASLLERQEHALTEARDRETVAADADAEARRVHTAMATQEAALAPQLAEARALDLQLADATERCGSLESDAALRAEALAEAERVEASARRAHDAAQVKHESHVSWLTAHEGWQPLAQREEELAGNLTLLAATDAAHALKVDERADLDARQQAALERWSCAQEVLANAELAHVGAAKALAETEAALPPEARLTDLSAERDTLAEIERIRGDLGHTCAAVTAAEEALAVIRARDAETVTRKAEVEELLASLADDLPVLRAQQAEARRACALSDAAAEEAAQVLRAGLEDGEPCPVCGATEHRLSALDALLGEQRLANRQRADELEAELAAKERRDAEMAAEQRGLERQAENIARDLSARTRALAEATERRNHVAADLAARAADADLPADAAALAPALDARRKAADAELAALGKSRSAAALARQAEQAARDDLDTARNAHTAAQDALRMLARALSEVDRDLADLDRERERLSLALGLALTPLGDWQALGDPLASLRTCAGAWRDRLQARDEIAPTLPALRTAMAAARDALASARAHAGSADDALAKARAAQTRLSGARSALLGGEDTDAVAGRLTAARSSAAEALEAARALRESTAQDRSAAEAHVTAARGRHDEAAADHAQRDAALTAALTAADLTPGEVARIAAMGAGSLESEAAALAALDTALAERRAVLTKCRDDLAAHEADGRPALLGAELADAIAAATTLRNDATERRGEAEFTLRRDDEVRDRTARLRADHDRESAAAEVWLKLADLIGDATGNKFRRFAQGLTLDRLLEHANARLADLKPRYTLERGDGGDMLIQVIDNDMAGEVRGLHNLSGGERFLVSLALALGLAEMSTASGVRIESLFIDEGFGALDPASLGQAIAVLEHLHASGRRVGVISHVEELKERIPVKIEVTPTGRGTSEITVVTA